MEMRLTKIEFKEDRDMSKTLTDSNIKESMKNQTEYFKMEYTGNNASLSGFLPIIFNNVEKEIVEK